MNNKKLILFVLFVGLQLLVIGGFFAQRLYTLSTGAEVALRTVPVDPRDLIRGEYVALRYEISQISSYLSDEDFEVGDTVYVELEKAGYDGIWSAVGISKTLPTDYRIFIKGKVTSVGVDDIRTSQGGIGVEYGIERYFVEAGKGKELESSGRLKVFVKVDRSGASVIDRVEPIDSADFLDGEFESVPVVSPEIQANDSAVRSQLSSIRTALKTYYETSKDYGTPFAASACPSTGDSVFSKNSRVRQSILILKENAVSISSVRCASGAQGVAFKANSWAISATLRSGGSLCVSSNNTTRTGAAFGGGVQPAVCR